MNKKSQGVISLSSQKSGRDDYIDKYDADVKRHSEWLDRGAQGKTKSVLYLLNRNQVSPTSILELGCGTGSILRNLEKRKIGAELFGIDFSSDAIQYLKSMSNTIHCAVGDITDSINEFGRRSYDVILISHTLEHLERPIELLESIKQLNFNFLICEVPLEDLFFGKLKAVINDRTKNSAGHVQFFSRRSFRTLAEKTNYVILADRLYAPIFDLETIRFAYSQYGILRVVHKSLTERYLPLILRPVWCRLYHAHYALLCRVK